MQLSGRRRFTPRPWAVPHAAAATPRRIGEPRNSSSPPALTSIGVPTDIVRKRPWTTQLQTTMSRWQPSSESTALSCREPKERRQATTSEERMSEEEAFLVAIFADPQDDCPRLVYSDWLEERGQPE